MTLLPDARLDKHPQVTYRELADGGVLLQLESGQYHGVNDTGLAIWELLDGRRTVAEVVTSLREELEEAPPELESEVVAFLQGLLDRQLVVS